MALRHVDPSIPTQKDAPRPGCGLYLGRIIVPVTKFTLFEVWTPPAQLIVFWRRVKLDRESGGAARAQAARDRRIWGFILGFRWEVSVAEALFWYGCVYMWALEVIYFSRPCMILHVNSPIQLPQYAM